MGSKIGISNVTDSLIFALDASNPRCYKSGSTDVYDLIKYTSNSGRANGTTPLTGSLINGVTFNQSTSSAFSFDFDGTDDKLKFRDVGDFTYPLTSTKGSNGGLPGTSSGITITVHFKWTTTQGSGQRPLYYIRDESAGSNRGSIYLVFNWASFGNKIIRFGGAGPFNSGYSKDYTFDNSTLSPYKWHDLTMTAFVSASIGYQNLYIDGEIVSEYSESNLNKAVYDFDSNVSFEIADSNEGFYSPLQCQVGGLYIYDRLLTDDEILQNVRAYDGRFNFNN
jgi:hypothetical protein